MAICFEKLSDILARLKQLQQDLPNDSIISRTVSLFCFARLPKSRIESSDANSYSTRFGIDSYQAVRLIGFVVFQQYSYNAGFDVK